MKTILAVLFLTATLLAFAECYTYTYPSLLPIYTIKTTSGLNLHPSFHSHPFLHSSLISSILKCPKIDENRISVYDPKHEECHKILTKGPCRKDEVITLDIRGEPVCIENDCYKLNKDDEPEYFRYLDKCYKLGETCEENHTLRFGENSFLPLCYKN